MLMYTNVCNNLNTSNAKMLLKTRIINSVSKKGWRLLWCNRLHAQCASRARFCAGMGVILTECGLCVRAEIKRRRVISDRQRVVGSFAVAVDGQ